MKQLLDTVWQRRGTSWIWDEDARNLICAAGEVWSLRRFLQAPGQWPDELPSNGSNTLVVAGLEGSLDLLTPEDADSWLAGIIKPTARLMGIVFGATAGIALLYLVAFVFSLFGVDLYFWNTPTPLGIGISVAIVAIACLNLIADFAMVDFGVDQGLPAGAEWFCAFGLLSTLLWMYLEILRLLALLRP